MNTDQIAADDGTSAVADARDCTCMADAYCKVHGNVPKPAHASERSLPEHPCPKCRTMMEPIGGEAYACKKCGYSSVGAAHASEPWTVVGGFSDTTEMCWHKIDFGNGEHMMLHETPAAIHRLLEVHNATLSQRPTPAMDASEKFRSSCGCLVTDDKVELCDKHSGREAIDAAMRNARRGVLQTKEGK